MKIRASVSGGCRFPDWFGCWVGEGPGLSCARWCGEVFGLTCWKPGTGVCWADGLLAWRDADGPAAGGGAGGVAVRFGKSIGPRSRVDAAARSFFLGLDAFFRTSMNSFLAGHETSVLRWSPLQLAHLVAALQSSGFSWIVPQFRQRRLR